MKKYFYLPILALTVLIISCTNEQYSCDPLANTWVKENMSVIKSMTRSTWLKLDESEPIKRAAFVALSPEKQRLFWEDKITEVVEQFEWTDQEMEHLNLLLNFIKKTDIFYKDEVDENFEIFVYQWNDYALNELKWTKKLIFSIAASGDKLINKDGGVLESTKDELTNNHIASDPENPGYSVCTCSQRSDFCDPFNDIPDWVLNCNSYNYNCNNVPGCGLLWQFTCDGICKSPIG